MSTASANGARAARLPEPPSPAETTTSRPLRPLAVSQIGLAEHLVRSHVVTLPVGTRFEDCLESEFWVNVVDWLHVCDKIEVFDARNRLYAELLVRAVVQGRSIQGQKGGARVHVLRHVELEPVVVQVRPAGHEVKYMGPRRQMVRRKISDGALIARNLDSKEMAEQHADRMATASV